MKQRNLFVAAGATFGVSYLVFVDGAVHAKQAGLPYNFLMWLPQLLSLCAIFLFLFVSPGAIMRTEPQYEDENEELRVKSLFFIGVVMHFASLGVAVWKMSDPYIESNNGWPGAALLLQALLLLVANSLLFMARTTQDSDEAGDDEMDL